MVGAKLKKQKQSQAKSQSMDRSWPRAQLSNFEG